MFSEKDFERLWFLYKSEGEFKGIFINSFCISNNIPYTAFYDWFKKKVLQNGANVNVDETWFRYHAYNKKRKTYMWCLVNRKARIVIFFYEDTTEMRVY